MKKSFRTGFAFLLAAFFLIMNSCSQTDSKEAAENEIQKEKADMSTTNKTTITLHNNPIHTVGKLPAEGAKAPDFTLTDMELNEKSLSDYSGKFIIMNIFPSVNTGVCSKSVRKFNEDAAALDNAVVLCISKDLPFAQKKFCAAEGIDNVVMLSDFRNDFGNVYGVKMTDGPMRGLLSRAVVVVNPNGEIVYEQQVPEIGEEPDYNSALAAVK